MSRILALDQGTSSSRSIVFDEQGRILAQAQQEITQYFPQPGWVEHDPLEIWESQRATARAALAQAGLDAGAITAIGITNQRETTLLWERKSGKPVHRAIVWQDRRTESICARLHEAGLEPEIMKKTGLRIDAYFAASKLMWLLDHVPDARARARRGELAFGTVDTWLLWQLTGGRAHRTDVTNASRTMLFDIHRNAWDETLLEAMDIPVELLPEVLPSGAEYGALDAGVLGAPIPICGIAGDQQSALFGQACFHAGMAKNTYGTGCFALMHTGAHFRSSDNGLITTSAAQTAPQAQYALEGGVFIGGAVVQWLRDGLHAIRASSEIEALARSVPDAGGVMLVPAFTGLGAPYWRPDARGIITGLTRGSTIAHIARAALESIAYQSTALLAAMNRDAMADDAVGLSEVRVDGGACVNDLLMQFQADLLGIPVVRPAIVETTALGAAYLAGLSSGVFADLDAVSSLWQMERRFEPQMDRARARAAMEAWDHAVRQACRD